MTSLASDTSAVLHHSEMVIPDCNVSFESLRSGTVGLTEKHNKTRKLVDKLDESNRNSLESLDQPKHQGYVQKNGD